MESWTLGFNDLNFQNERLRESLFTLGNGYFATRGTAEEAKADLFHYPGTYLAGGYNRLKSEIHGHVIENEDLVNWPNWLCLDFRHPGEDWFDLKNVKIISYSQKLNILFGELNRTIHFEDSKGRNTEINIFRFVSMDNPHVAGIRWSITPLNWDSKIEVRSWIDGSVRNLGVSRYKSLSNKHLKVINKDWFGDDFFYLESMTGFSQIRMNQTIRTEVFDGETKIKTNNRQWSKDECIGIDFELDLKNKKELVVEKIMTIFTSKDHASSQPCYESRHLLQRQPDYKTIFKRHSHQWERLWGLCDIELPGKIRENRLLRLHIFHLLQTVSLKSIDLDVGVPARGLHGESYRGHVFWDEIYILPFLNLRLPELSRSLLMYRYRRLDEARVNAQKNGFKGAMFPWQSGSNGEEESQMYHLNPASGHWLPDATLLQRHINATILYNIWQFYQSTDDKDFLSLFGIEMAIEISRFWISALTFNQQTGKYELNKVVGPDEFHTQYPDKEQIGINNNAYTNYMASWCIRTTIDMFLKLAEDRQNEILILLDISRVDLLQWQEISRKIYLPLREDGILSQFDGFEDLKDLNWDHYKKKYGDIQRIDRILEAEGDSVNRYKVNKQCDVLMLYYLFSQEDLTMGFEWMGYHFDSSHIQKNIDYHLSLSTNGSTLSRIVHAWVLSRYDSEKSWEWFNRALETDIADIQGGTTSEGIHLGAMAGTVDLIQRCFTGIEIRNEILWICPRLPNELDKMRLLIHFRGHSLELNISGGFLDINVKRSLTPAGKLAMDGVIYDFKQGSKFKFPIKSVKSLNHNLN
jgi:trehalose/maltose hydrolase-like predicted phosphorylase